VLFRRSLHDSMQRSGHLPADAPAPDLEALWPRQRSLSAHLTATCAQWWLAEDEQGEPAGYARTIERTGTVELTEFFVAPQARVVGVGHGLLERAFAPAGGEHRMVIATTDAPAIALYLRFGVCHQTTGIDVGGVPRPIALPAGYETEPATAGEVLAIERELLGHGRPQEVEFMLADRPATLLRRGGRAVAYVFEPNEHGHAGPVAALQPADLPAALARLEGAAHAAGLQTLELTLPLAATTAVDWLLRERRFRVDPFVTLFLADGPWARLDRYLPFNPCLFL
jgi:GNAT superfamily N-acetyltransferase